MESSIEVFFIASHVVKILDKYNGLHRKSSLLI